MVSARKVLVVDDEPIVNESCRRVLGEEGYDVDTTESGREGLRRACSRAYDLVITDLKMPDMDGMDLIRSLRGRRAAMPVLVITGYGSVPSALKAVRLGVSDYIEKPFTPMRLTQAVHEALAEEEAIAFRLGRGVRPWESRVSACIHGPRSSGCSRSSPSAESGPAAAAAPRPGSQRSTPEALRAWRRALSST